MKLWKCISALCLALVTLGISSCERDVEPMPGPEQFRKVFILYSCGYNNLAPNLYKNIQELCRHLPSKKLDRFYKVLIFSHLTREMNFAGETTRSSSDFITPCNPVLIDACIDEFGKVCLDTLVVYPADRVSASAAMVSEVLTYIRDNYPAKEYGMVMSSHATGWLPLGYYSTKTDDDPWGVWSMYGISKPLPQSSYLATPEGPAVKSMCAQFYGISTPSESDEIEIRDFVSVIPMHLKYLVLDMCLMGGVEMAYELEGKVDYLAFSQTEVLSDGFFYESMLDRLLYDPQTDVQGVCEDYFNYYSTAKRPATVSLVDCNRMGNLGRVCADLFSKYSYSIDHMNPDKVQKYFRYVPGYGYRHWFYDLRDILVNAGITADETGMLDSALAECVLYKQATPRFLELEIKKHSGLSMYLPQKGSAVLDEFYKDFRWNKATSLVK